MQHTDPFLQHNQSQRIDIINNLKFMYYEKDYSIIKYYPGISIFLCR